MGFSKRKNKWDMFRSGKNTYIVRTDGENTTALVLDNKYNAVDAVFLPSSLANGDAYLGQDSSSGKMCIRKDKCWRSDNIDANKPSTVSQYELHAEWQGADHYFQRDFKYYAIKGTKMWVGTKNKNMATAPAKKDYDVAKEAQNALCYFAQGNDVFYVTETDDKNGLLVHKVSSLTKVGKHTTQELPKPVLKFVPGGLALNYDQPPGTAPEMRFVEKYSYTNGTQKAEPTTAAFEWYAGRTEDLETSREKHWYTEATVGVSYEVSVFSVVARAELSMTAGGGGKQIVTSRESWNKAEKLSAAFRPTVEPGKTISYWQGVAGFGGHAFITGRSIISKSDGLPPNVDEYRKDYFTAKQSKDEWDPNDPTKLPSTKPPKPEKKTKT